MSIERRALTLGFMALTDAAPLIVAKARGLFAAEGLDVTLSRQASWANLRDKLAAGLIDGAHLLAPMAVAQSLGIGGEPTPLSVPLALNAGGSAVTLSRSLLEALRDAEPALGGPLHLAASLGRLVEQRRRLGRPPLTFGVVFPYSIHHYQLRGWLAAGGVDPDRDVRLTVVPPPRMVEKLAGGELEGFCVGAPWSDVAVREGLGVIVLTATDWWGAGPDKVFGVTRTWAQRNPETLQGLLRALLVAAGWADRAENRAELAAILTRPEHVGVAESAIRPGLLDGDGLVFQRHAAGFPWRSHAQWFLTQMIRWGQAPRSASFADAAAVYEPALFRTAAAAVGQSAPMTDAKPEGAHRTPWILPGDGGPIAMAADAFLDGRVFDPSAPLAYVDSLPLGRAASEMGATS